MYFPVSPTSAGGPAMPRTMREFIRAASTSPTKQPRSHSPSRRDSLAASFASSLSPCTSPRLAQLQESPRRVFTTTCGSNNNTGNAIAHVASCEVNMSVEDRRTFSDEANSLLCPRPASAGALAGGGGKGARTTTTVGGRSACHRLPRPCHMSGSQTDYEDNYAGASSSSCVSSQRVLTTEERTRRERSLQRESDRCSGVSASLRVTNTASHLSTAEYGEGEGEEEGEDVYSRGSTPCLSVGDTRAGTRMGRSESFIAAAAHEAAPDTRALTPASNLCEEVKAAVIGVQDGSSSSGCACVRTVCTPPHEDALQSATPRLFVTSSAVQKRTTTGGMQPMLALSRFPSSPQHIIREQLVQDAAQLASSYRSNSPARLSASSSSFSSLFTNDLTAQTSNNNDTTNGAATGANYASGAMPVGATPLMWRPQTGPTFPLPRAPPRLGSTNAQLACAPFAGNAATQSARAWAAGPNAYLASPSPRPPQMEAELGGAQVVRNSEAGNTESTQTIKTGQERAAVHAECHMAMPWAPQLTTSATQDTTSHYTNNNNNSDAERMMHETECDMPHPRRFHDAMTMEHIEQLIARGRPRVESAGARPGGTLAQAIQAALPETSSLITTTANTTTATNTTETSSFTMYTSETGSTRRAVSPSRPRASPSPPHTSLADSDECESEGSLLAGSHVSEMHRNTPATTMMMTMMPLSSNPVVATAATMKRKGVERVVSGACAPPPLINASPPPQQQRTQYSTSLAANNDNVAAAKKYASTATRLADRVAAEETLPPPSTGPIVTNTTPRLHSRPPPVLSTTTAANTTTTATSTTAVGRRTIRFIEPCVTPHALSPARAEDNAHHIRADTASHTLHDASDAQCVSDCNGAALLSAPQEEGGRLSDLSVYEPLDEEPQIDEVRYLREEIENESADAEALAAARRDECAQRLCARSQQARDEELHTRSMITGGSSTSNNTAVIHTPSHGSWQSSSKATTEFEEVDAEAMRCGWMTLRDSSPPVRDRSMAPHELLEERRRHTATTGAAAAAAAAMMRMMNTQKQAHDM